MSFIIIDTEAEIHLPLFLDSSVSSLVDAGRASSHQIPIDRQLPDGPLVVELTFVKCHQRLVVYPMANVQP